MQKEVLARSNTTFYGHLCVLHSPPISQWERDYSLRISRNLLSHFTCSSNRLHSVYRLVILNDTVPRNI